MRQRTCLIAALLAVPVLLGAGPTGPADPDPWDMPNPNPLASAAPRPTPKGDPSPMPVRTRGPLYKPRPQVAAPIDLAGWPYNPPPPATLAAHGAVASVSAIASQVGVDVLKRGGSAVDAAVAVAFALAVVYPEAGNVGGGGFMLVRQANGETAALDYREVAPAASSAKMYLDHLGNVTPKSQIGPLAAGVPGTVAGLEAAHKRYGRRPWRELVQPAIRLAREGFRLNPYLAGSFMRGQDLLLRFPESRLVFMPQGVVPKVGEKLVQADLARTLTAIAGQGAAGFYRGPVAQAIAADIKANGGVMTTADLAGYQVRWRQPLSFTYRGHTIVGFPPPSSGAVTMAQILNILEGYDLRALGWHSPRHIHAMVEAERRAYTDRNAYLGDPDFVAGMPTDVLASKSYAEKRRKTILPDQATPQAGRKGGLEPVTSESEETTHFCVVDAQGNTVSNTYTLNGNYGCGMVAKGTGVLLNNEMDDFAVKPGAANMFGLVQGERNAIAPKKRMLSSMSPTIVLGPGGRPLIVTGSPGGSTIITTVAQVISNMIDFGQSPNWAVSAPRIHHQGQPDLVYFENKGMDLATRTTLVAMGHPVRAREPIGDAMILFHRPDGAWEAFADPRRGGEAIGY